MPMDRRAALQLGMLLLAVPAQYLITKYVSTNEAQRSYAIRNILSSAVGFRNKYLSWQSWHKWCSDLLSRVKAKKYKPPKYKNKDDPKGESPAVEVMKYRDPEGYFAGSPEPRSPRPPQVKYRVGQVIKHKKWGYRGVIIGWDPVAKAPESWLKQMHPADKPNWTVQPFYLVAVDSIAEPEPIITYASQEGIEPIDSEYEKGHWRKRPNYSVLVDTRDRLSPQRTYVVEENIQIVTNVRVFHPLIDEYFESYDGAQYLPRPWLRALYPHD